MITEYRILACDSCGTEQVIKETTSESGRLVAAHDGWKSFSYGALMIGSKSRSRLWDCCPKCPLPERSIVVAHLEKEAASS